MELDSSLMKALGISARFGSGKAAQITGIEISPYSHTITLKFGTKADLIAAAGEAVLNGVDIDNSTGSKLATWSVKVDPVRDDAGTEHAVTLTYSEHRARDLECPICGRLVYNDECHSAGVISELKDLVDKDNEPLTVASYAYICTHCWDFYSRRLVPCEKCGGLLEIKDAVGLGYDFSKHWKFPYPRNVYHKVCRDLMHANKKAQDEAAQIAADEAADDAAKGFTK